MKTYLKSLVTATLALAAAFVTGSALADTDELNLTPKHWYKYNGDMTSSGETAVSIGGENGGAYFDGVSDKAMKIVDGNTHPYGSGVQYGNGAWSIVTVAKAAFSGSNATIFWATGVKGDWFGLLATDVNTVEVAAGNGGGITDHTLTATVDDATAYHVYVIVYDGNGGLSLFVDGELGASKTGYTPKTNGNFQWGAVNQGMPSGISRVTNTGLDDWRLYQLELTAEQVKTITGTFIFDTYETTITKETVSVSDINNADAFSGYGDDVAVVVNLVGTKTFLFDEDLRFIKATILLDGALNCPQTTGPNDLRKFDFSGVTGGVIYNWLELGSGIAVNFHQNSGTIAANADSAIPRLPLKGSCWNNTEGANGTIDAVVFAPGGEMLLAGTTAKVTWSSATTYQGTGASGFLNGYIDDGNPSPTIRIDANVPFDRYDVLIFATTDMSNSKFRPFKVNGEWYTWSDSEGKTVVGTQSQDWGMSRQTAPIYGKNILRVTNQTSPALTIEALPRNGGVSRGCIAAIVIVKTHEVRDYSWEGMNGDWTDLANWFVGDNRATELPTEFDTVDFYSRAARTITVPAEGVTVKSISIGGDHTYQGGTITLADKGYGSTIKGTATFVFDGDLPDEEVVDDFQNTAWKGTVWLKNATGLANIDFTKYGNANTTVKCTDISGYFAPNTEFTGTLALENGETGYALNIHDGSSDDGNVVTFDHLTGAGKILGDGGSTAGFLVKDWAGFTGDVVLTNKTVTFGDIRKANVNKIIVNPGFAYTLVGQTWSATSGIQIDGTIGGKGALVGTASFGLNATLDASGTELLTVNTLPVFAETNKFVVASAPADGVPVKVLAAAEGETLATKTYDTVPVIIVGGAEVECQCQVKAAADGIYLEKVSGTFDLESADATVTASALNHADLANADGASIVTITLTGEDPTIVLDEPINGGDIRIVHKGNLTISAVTEPADFGKYDLRSVTGFIRYSWLAMKRVVNLNFDSGAGSFGEDEGEEGEDEMANDGLLAGNTPKASWINLGDDASNDGVVITNAWHAGDFDEVEIEAMTVGWKAKTVWSADHDLPVMRGYLDDGDANWPDGVTITLKDVPFEAYDVIVYYNTDMADRVYPAVKVNGVAYTWDGEAGKTVFGSDNWGETISDGVAYGKNALRISDLSGDVKITTAPADSDQSRRGCVPAIQIVEVEKKANSFVADTNVDVRVSELNAKVPDGYTGVFTLTLNGGDLIYDTNFVCGALFVNATAAMTITTDGAEISETELAKINLAKVEGEVTFEIPRVPLATSDNGSVYTVGVGTEEEPVSLDYPVENGSMTIQDGTFYLDATAGGATSTVSFVDATIFATNGQGLAVGMADFTLSGATTVTASKVILSEGEDDRIASLTLNDTAKIIVTGETIIDENTSSIMFGHWDGPSTFTMNDNAEFLATNAQVLVGKTSNNHTINLNGGTFVAKGIKASGSANLTNTLNLAGTTLYLGEFGISSYSANTKIDVNVLEDTTIYATDPTITLTQPITVAEGKTLTIIADTVNFGGLRDLTHISEHFDLTEVEAVGLTATLEEYGAGKATIVGIPEKFETIYFEANGEILELSVENGKANYDVEPHISGEACWYDFTFTNTVTTAAGSMVETTLNCDHDAVYVQDGDDVAIQTRAWPWHLVPGLENLDNYAVTFVATMPQTLRTTAFYIGNDFADAGIQFATGNVKDEILVNYVTETEVREITTLTVPNAAEAYHCYMIAKLDDHTFVVYLDGLKWKTISTEYDIRTIKGGMQFGSDYGGRLQRLDSSNPQYYTNVQERDPSAFKFLRIYNRLLSEPEIAAYHTLYPYVDPNGASTRTLVAAEESWGYTDETTPWIYAKTGEETQELGWPMSGGAINLIENSASMVIVTNNLGLTETYSSITITGANGVRFVSESGAYGQFYPIKISGLVTIGAPVEIAYGALDISGAPLMLGESGAITFDCTNFSYNGIYGEKFIQLTGETDELPDGKITIIPPEPAFGLRAEGLYDEARRAYGLKVTVNRNAMRLFIKEGTSELVDGTEYETEDGSESVLRLRSDDEVILRSEETLAINNGSLALPLRKLAVEGTAQLPAVLKLASGWGYTDTVVVGANGTYDVDGQDDNAVNLVLNGGTLANTGASTDFNLTGTWKISVTSDSYVNVPLAEDEASRVLHSLASKYNVFDYNLNTNTLTKTGAGEYCIVNGRFNSGKLIVKEGTLTIDTLVVTNGEDLAVEVHDGAWLLTVNGAARVSSIGGTVDYELLTPRTTFENGAKIRFSGTNYLKNCEQWTFADDAKVTLDAEDGATFRWFKPIGADSEMFFPNAAAVTMTPAFTRMMRNSDYKISEQDGNLVISRMPKFLMILK